AKEATGKATGNEGMEMEGRADQAKGDAKQAIQKIKDATKH
ncbi:MAG: CsbD-like, partial [Streptomyces sp.]|nr:CsbD-like [Streptomyces sp.]